MPIHHFPTAYLTIRGALATRGDFTKDLGGYGEENRPPAAASAQNVRTASGDDHA